MRVVDEVLRPARSIAKEGAPQSVRDHSLHFCDPVVILLQLTGEGRSPVSVLEFAWVSSCLPNGREVRM